ncbi:MAG: ABC transporter permease [Gemmatimonadota bacterium]
MMRRLASSLVRGLLALYPASFRSRFRTDLASAVEDRLDTIWAGSRFMAPALVAGLAADVLFAAVRERLHPSFHAAAPSTRPTTGLAPGVLVTAMIQDLRFAFRSLLRRPGFSAVALFTLALGVGASTAVFTVVDGVLLEPLPFPEPDELVMAWAYDTGDGPVATSGGLVRGYMSQPDIESMRDVPVFESVEGLTTSGATVTGGDRPERVDIARSTGGLLTLLGVPPLMGRDLRHDDNLPDARRAVVVSHGFWSSRLGADPGVIGTTIELNERTWEIVGVAPADFDYPAGTEVWEPYRLDVADGCGRGCHVYNGALVRLADGVTLDVAQQALDALAASLSAEYPDSNFDKGLQLERLLDYRVSDVRTGLWVVLAAVGLVLLIVCANTANLLLVRASSRGREVAVRTALGASRGRLFTQVITESVVLAVLGSAFGLVLSTALLRGLQVLAGDRLPRMAEVGIDGGVLLFLVAVTSVVALLFGLSPALHVSGRRSAHRLSGGARDGARAGGRARSVLLAVEVAFSILLLAGSGFLLRSLDQLYRVDMGFDGEDVSRFTLSLPSARYEDLGSLVRFYSRLEDELLGLPGVESVGSVYGAPLAGGNISGSVLVEGRPDPQPGEETDASMRPVTPGYFATMGMTVLRGRGIEDTDLTDTEPVAVVNEAFVRQNFPYEEVLGQKIRVTASFGYGSPYWRVVGVVGDVRRTMSGDPVAEVYPPHTQYGPGFMQVHMRSRADVPSPFSAARDVVARLDPNLAMRGVETISEAKRHDTAGTRLFLMLVAMFAGVAIVLAGVGLYGVVAYLVSQRTREIGIRMALGARSAGVTRMVVLQGIRPTVLGIIGGLVLAGFGGQVMRSLLFGVRPTDPLVLSSVSFLVLFVAILATLLPARRATRVSPTEALRIE